jgi:tRNA (guanine-N7-)-methyltransferase
MNARDDALLAEGHRRALALRRQRVTALNATLADWFGGQTDLTLEIGCGHGHYLTAYAEHHPAEACLGVDLVTRRIDRALAKRDKRHLSHLHFVKADAWECLEALPETIALRRIFVLFPDPWPKKRHEKNRLLQHSLLQALANRAHPGATLHFRTDHVELSEWGLEQLETHPCWQVQASSPWPFEAGSFFQDLLGTYRSVTATVISGIAGA